MTGYRKFNNEHVSYVGTPRWILSLNLFISIFCSAVPINMTMLTPRLQLLLFLVDCGPSLPLALASY